jgi:adenine phosphoribosyltransferase
MMDYKTFIREMKGKNRCDFTKLLNDPDVFSSLVSDMAKPFLSKKIDKVVALDAMGFALGGAVAHLLKSGLVLARKGGKSAWLAESVDFSDYTKKRKKLEIVTDALRPNDNILIIDDWSETGAQLKATIRLIKKLGATVKGISCINFDETVRNDDELKQHKLHSIIKY